MSKREDWIKVHREASARYERLPCLTRGFFTEMLRKSKRGLFDLGTSDRSELWRVMITEPRERRGLGARLDALIENGSVMEHEWGWEIPNWEAYQSTKSKRAKPAPGLHQACTTLAPRLHEARTTLAPGVQSTRPKSPESLTPVSQTRGEETRGEEMPPKPPASTSDSGHSSDSIRTLLGKLSADAWSKRPELDVPGWWWRELTQDAPRDIAAWAERSSPRKPVAELVADAFAAWWAWDRPTSKGRPPPAKFFGRDVLGLLEAMHAEVERVANKPPNPADWRWVRLYDSHGKIRWFDQVEGDWRDDKPAENPRLKRGAA